MGFRKHNGYYLTFERVLWLLVIGLLIFFSRGNLMGLQPDAALYAGLSEKVLVTQEYWLLRGSPEKFEKYFEHPPYFFQWGSMVLQVLGSSEFAARAIGGIFGFLAFLLVCGWAWLRMGWVHAVISAVIIGTWGHFTKYAGSSMLEAPLAFATALVAVSSWELHWRPKTGPMRPVLWILVGVGLALAVAAKGVAGLGVWGGYVLSLAFALLFSERRIWKVLLSLVSPVILLVVAVVPFGLWYWMLWKREGIEWMTGYFFQQVMRSFTTNRGEDFHSASGSVFYYVRVLFETGFPWFWLVCLGYLCLALGVIAGFRGKTETASQTGKPFRAPVFRSWCVHGASFFVAFFIPFSLSTYQLPHYLHPTYAPLVPVASWTIVSLFRPVLVSRDWRIFEGVKPTALRWSACAVLGLFMILVFPRLSPHPNRGQEFINVASQVRSLPDSCQIWVRAQDMDRYRMEAYALWYWKGRMWRMVEQFPSRRLFTPNHAVFWYPETSVLEGRGSCQEKLREKAL